MKTCVGYIYLITNKVTNKVYVGKTTQTPYDRFQEHINESKTSDHFRLLHNSIKKYGEENFKVDTICSCYSTAELNECESFYISSYNSHYSSGLGYNMTYGGDGGDNYHVSSSVPPK